jgi:hypothetical protein
MHQCLTIAEVLDRIFSETWCSQRTLAMLARTCQGFHEPAIRNLYKHLSSFKPILNLLPREVLSRDTENCHDVRTSWPGRSDDFLTCIPKTINTFRWSLVRNDEDLMKSLNRMYHYTRHVRILDWVFSSKHSKSYGVHHAAFRKIYEHEGLARPLFPNLKDVELPYSRREPLVAVFYPSLVLSRSVERIGVTCNVHEYVDPIQTYRDTTDDSWRALAGRLRAVASTLCVFEIRTNDYEPNTLVGQVRILEQLLPDFSAITRLKISSIVLDHTTLASLGSAQLTRLVSLSVLAAAQTTVQPPANISFPALEQLSIKILSPDSCQAFLAHLTANRLKRLKLKAVMGSDEDGNAIDDNYDPEPLFRTLHTRGMGEHLEQVQLEKIWIDNDVAAAWYAYRNEQRFAVTPQTLQSLLPFKNITSFIVKTCDSSKLNDQTLVTLFRHWPKLERFALSDETFGSEPPVLTLHGLHRALSQVPALKDLCIRFDACSIPDDNAVATDLQQHPSLQVLDVASSIPPVASLGCDLALWLQKHYPSLSRIQSLTRYRDALDTVFENGDSDEEARNMFQPFIGLAPLVDRWNEVTYMFK